VPGIWHGVGPLGTHVGPALRRAFLVIPFVVPFVVHHLYQPVNAAWTVKRFGCGCPPLDDRWKFNANHFNLILWTLVGVACAAAWWWAVRAEFGDHSSLRYNWAVGFGVGLLLSLCLLHCAKEAWL
jgi:hypothetical protein